MDCPLFFRNRCVNQEEYVTALLSLLEQQVENEQPSSRHAFEEQLSKQIKDMFERVRQKELTKQQHAAFLLPPDELYPILYDILVSFPSELVRLVCGYHTAALLPSRLIKCIPRPSSREYDFTHRAGTLAVIDNDLVADLQDDTLHLVSLQSGTALRSLCVNNNTGRYYDTNSHPVYVVGAHPSLAHTLITLQRFQPSQMKYKNTGTSVSNYDSSVLVITHWDYMNGQRVYEQCIEVEAGCPESNERRGPKYLPLSMERAHILRSGDLFVTCLSNVFLDLHTFNSTLLSFRPLSSCPSPSSSSSSSTCSPSPHSSLDSSSSLPSSSPSSSSSSSSSSSLTCSSSASSHTYWSVSHEFESHDVPVLTYDDHVAYMHTEEEEYREERREKRVFLNVLSCRTLEECTCSLGGGGGYVCVGSTWSPLLVCFQCSVWNDRTSVYLNTVVLTESALRCKWDQLTDDHDVFRYIDSTRMCIHPSDPYSLVLCGSAFPSDRSLLRVSLPLNRSQWCELAPGEKERVSYCLQLHKLMSAHAMCKDAVWTPAGLLVTRVNANGMWLTVWK